MLSANSILGNDNVVQAVNHRLNDWPAEGLLVEDYN